MWEYTPLLVILYICVRVCLCVYNSVCGCEYLYGNEDRNCMSGRPGWVWRKERCISFYIIALMHLYLHVFMHGYLYLYYSSILISQPNTSIHQESFCLFLIRFSFKPNCSFIKSYNKIDYVSVHDYLYALN